MIETCPLPERVVKRVVDCLREHVEARCFLAVNINIQLQTVHLLVACHVAELRQLSKFLHEFRRPLCELGRIRVLQNVLKLRAANARIDLQILRCLHEKRDAFDISCGIAQPFDDFSAFARSLCGLSTM